MFKLREEVLLYQSSKYADIMSTQSKKPSVLLVEDHESFRTSLKQILRLENIATIIGEASNGKECLELLTVVKPDVVLMDLDMPLMNGLETTKIALELVPDIKIMAYTMFKNEVYIFKMIELGAKGFILKSSGINELEKAIDIVFNGGQYFNNGYNIDSIY